MRMRVLREKLRVEIENETRVFLESLNFEIEMRVSQKSATPDNKRRVHGWRMVLNGRKSFGLADPLAKIL